MLHERQFRLGLFVGGIDAILRDRHGKPVERTKASLATGLGAVHEHVGRAGTARILRHAHLNPRGRTRSTTAPEIRTRLERGCLKAANHRNTRNATIELALLLAAFFCESQDNDEELIQLEWTLE